MKRETGLMIAAFGFLLLAQTARADWTSAKRLTWDAESSSWPFIVVDPLDNYHLVWCDDRPGNSKIYYRKSTDGGTTWTSARRLTWTSGNSFRPAVAVDSSDIILVVWDDITPGNLEIYFKRSN